MHRSKALGPKRSQTKQVKLDYNIIVIIAYYITWNDTLLQKNSC